MSYIHYKWKVEKANKDLATKGEANKEANK